MRISTLQLTMQGLSSALIIAVTAGSIEPHSLGAQERIDSSMIARIRDEGLNHSKVAALFDHLTNVIGPRLTASPGFREAVDWAATQLRSYELANVHLESWPFGRGWALEQLTLEMITPRYFPLIGYPEAWTPSTAGEIVGRPVYIGDFANARQRPRSRRRVAWCDSAGVPSAGTIHHR